MCKILYPTVYEVSKSAIEQQWRHSTEFQPLPVYFLSEQVDRLNLQVTIYQFELLLFIFSPIKSREKVRHISLKKVGHTLCAKDDLIAVISLITGTPPPPLQWRGVRSSLDLKITGEKY